MVELNIQSKRDATTEADGFRMAIYRAIRGAKSSIWDDQPIREELFSIERLEEYGRSLAAAQSVGPAPLGGRNLSNRLADNRRVLIAAYRDAADAVATGAAITPAAEWLLDNFHVVEEQIREVASDLPHGFYRQLPKLAAGPFAGLPRIFCIAWTFAAHTDSLFSPEALRRYVRAYQEIQPLTIGELWAVAITLRVVLVENLRRIAALVVGSRAGRRDADLLADRLLGARGLVAEPAETVLADIDPDRLTEAFFVQLVQRLRDQDPSIAPALDWLDERLAVRGSDPDQVVRDEHQRQVSASVTVRNIITSMRLVSDVDWSELVESLCLVDDLLLTESRFGEMDFPTRNLYRTAIEELARGSHSTELDVAEAALAAAHAAPADPDDARRSDPGYYLVGTGRARLERAIGFRPPLRLQPGRVYRALGIGGYVAAGALVSAALLTAPLVFLARAGLPAAWLWALGVLGVAPAVDLAVALVNSAVTRGFRATLLPALELKGGVPPDLRTLIAVPVMLTSAEAIAEQVERLETHYLASPPGALHFALLADWMDADAETVAGDETLLVQARAAIADLNHRHGPASAGDRFLLLHRRRVWNESERRWIGWERKRGKLTELNRLLRGADDTTYLTPAKVPDGVRYVITLDVDTRLPRETVRRLIGKMAHPLNRPRFDARLDRVVEGYGILQPRVTPALPVGFEGSLFLKIFSSATGIDPYAAAVSDVYQDLFGEGSYTGKGIYDVDAFELALAGRVPDSTLLSHDLFEGIFARAGLASDVEVVEDFPARYGAAALRHHRWARGDWQLLPWLIGLRPRSPTARRSSVPMIGRWKMLDNVRRSLSAPATVAALLAGWAAPQGAAITWTSFLLATIVLPPLLPVLAEIPYRRPGVALRTHLMALGSDLGVALVQVGLMLVFLAHQAWLMGDAVIRTLFRLIVTRRHLLEWTPAAQASFGSNPSIARFYRQMAGAVVIAVAAALSGWHGGPRDAWPFAAFFTLAWALSPAIARWASLSPRAAGRRPIDPADADALRAVARRTWRFFESFVTEDSHWLPPDNFQETPAPVVANRTSPTNIGLYLLSVVSAREFGWIGDLEAAERIEATMTTLGRLERYKGHLYNWYSTSDLRPLDPKYVSSVDSGNLAGHLIALAGRCRAWRGSSQDLQAAARGALDAVVIARAAASAADGQLSVTLLSELDRLAAGIGGGSNREAGVIDDFERALDAARALAIASDDSTAGGCVHWIEAARRCLESHRRDAAEAAQGGLNSRLEALEQNARAMALEMDFAFLLDPDRLLLSIGYSIVGDTRDANCYDLLASEARLASFIAIAKGDAPTLHWFRLGRVLTPLRSGGAALISWSGSMFEYLMPSLVMQAPAGSLLDDTNRRVVRRQIDYGKAVGAPWGVSESAYNARDLELTYQYSNFGVPDLGLKRGLADNVVVAPYATALAAMIDPRAAIGNLKRLAQVGAIGQYGYYEAIDYTPDRVPEGQQMAVVQTFMAHHQGMSIAAIADAVLDGPLRAGFHDDPMVQATELLLQERIPRNVVSTPLFVSAAAATRAQLPDLGEWRNANPWAPTPDTQLLSNGRYSVMMTASGAGYATWRGMAVTRWREDATRDDWGAWIYLRDTVSGEIWSAGLQPTGAPANRYDVVFNEDRVEITQLGLDLETTLEVIVSAEDDAEVRRIALTNLGAKPREIEVTSYVELALAPAAADISHPAFSKLFIQTEHLPTTGALLAHRRRRSPSEPEIWAAHLAVLEGQGVGAREFETDRARFIGRGGDVQAPMAIAGGRTLSGSVGTVIDPIFALKRRVRVEPGRTARIAFWTMVGDSRDQLLGLIDKHHDVGAFPRAAALAWTQNQVQLHHLGIDRAEAGQLQRLASFMIYPTATLRAPSDAIEAGAGAQSSLWGLGVSGDLPIVLVRVSEPYQLDLVRQALLAFEYWRSKGLAVDLVILNERGASYVQDMQTGLDALVRACHSRTQLDDVATSGHIFLLRADLVAPEAVALLTATARVILLGERGRLSDQMEYAPEAPPLVRNLKRRTASASELEVPRPAPDIDYFNGFGGFDAKGREYVILIGPGQTTPAPWINVIANPEFGFQTSAEGGGYAWSMNAKDHQLTPWSNDPITDPAGQAMFVRDDETGELWTATAKPLNDGDGTYVARHGFGYSRFEHAARGLALDLLEYVPLEDPVRISRLTIRNLGPTRRKLSITGYAEWVLGSSREATAPFVRTKVDPETRALFASNSWNPTFAQRCAFIDLAGRQTSWTGDRREFIGRNGSLALPQALTSGAKLSGRVGGGLDPCGALRTSLELAPGASAEIVLFLGDAADEAAAKALVARWRGADLDGALAEVRRYWDDTLDVVQVKTPDRSMDLMLNGWLLYQTLSCRLLARTGFYQASGAYGFRDQLQDVIALTVCRPDVTRAHLLRTAAQQFLEGDVLHWWLPHSGQGVRTRISDDRLWLPYAVAHYLETTGDAAVLDEPAPFLQAPPLAAGEAERFFRPDVSQDSASLYEHCVRAIDASLAVGRHGLPLIGGGDWNDGLNRVGQGGHGESVWLGWFLITNLDSFANVADARGDAERATRWRKRSAELKTAIEREAWDGDWYRRGWFDDGTVFGSGTNAECRIDSISQSWAVLSGAAEPDRARRAMEAVERELVLPQDALALLFAPPFDKSGHDPGYIMGYPPGIRENGGQYTHGATWSVMALAALGEGGKAAALFWMLNPINHARTRTDAYRYKVEPYASVADIYTAREQFGRGGWTWYTGSAGWLQRAGLESILGIRVRAGRLEVDPCIPRDWPGFEASVRCGAAVYDIKVSNPNSVCRGVVRATLDAAPLTGPACVALKDDGRRHRLEITLG